MCRGHVGEYDLFILGDVPYQISEVESKIWAGYELIKNWEKVKGGSALIIEVQRMRGFWSYQWFWWDKKWWWWEVNVQSWYWGIWFGYIGRCTIPNFRAGIKYMRRLWVDQNQRTSRRRVRFDHECVKDGGCVQPLWRDRFVETNEGFQGVPLVKVHIAI